MKKITIPPLSGSAPESEVKAVPFGEPIPTPAAASAPTSAISPMLQRVLDNLPAFSSCEPWPNPSRFSPEHERLFEQLGLGESQIVPMNLAEILDVLRRELYAQHFLVPQPDDKRTGIDFFLSLTGNLRAAFVAWMREKAKHYVEHGPEEDEGPPSAAGKAYREVDNLASASTEEESHKVTVDRMLGPKTLREESPTDTTTSSAPTMQFCPVCSHDLSQEDPTGFVSDADKLAFLASLGGGQEFEKSFTLFGGRLIVIFRELSAKNSRLIYEAITKGAEAGVIPEAMRGSYVFFYRMVFQIVSITWPEADKMVSWSEDIDRRLQAANFAPEKDVDPLYRFLREEVCRGEHTWTVLFETLLIFEKLAKKLISNRGTDSFWPDRGKPD